MTRPILFRGKRLDNGEWVEGDIVHLGEGAIIITASTLGHDLPDDCDHALEYRSDEFAAVDLRTVGQWTGLVDCKGKRIFEGDIIECLTSKREPIRHLVRYDKSQCAYVQYRGEINGAVWTLCDCGGIFQSYIYEMEKYIIGNAYDNPEKLK